MAKFILTNSNECTQQSISFSTNEGYKVSGNVEIGKTSFVCYHKLSLDNENFLEIGEDFVSVIGTVIYKDSIGKESLKKIYADFDGDVNAIRDHVLGNGAFIIKKSNEITIFCEYLGLYQIFYTANNGKFMVSNDLYDICKLCVGLEADTDNLILRSLMAGVYGNDTEVKGVHYLRDCEKIVVNIETGDYKIEKVDVEWRSHENLSYNEIVQKVGDFLKESALTFSKHFGIPGLSSTGGLDNRLNLASFLAVGINPTLYYGVGNSAMTNTYNGDMKINQAYAEKYGLTLNVISWKNATPINRDWEEMARLYGMHSVHYAGSKDFNQAYRNIKNKLLLFGCMGEIYRIDDNTYLEENNFSNYTLDEYIDQYPIGHYWNQSQCLFKDTARIHDHIKSKLLPICKKWNLDPNNLTANDDMILWMERMHRSDIYIPNLMNRHHYCAFLNAQYQVVRLLTLLHPKEKSNAKFHIDLLRYVYPSIMEVPIFSRCHLWVYNRDSNTMSFPLKLKTINMIKRFLPISFIPIFLKKLVRSNEKERENKFDKMSELEIGNILKKHGLVDGIDVKVCPLGRLSGSAVLFAQLLSIFDQLNIKFSK